MFAIIITEKGGNERREVFDRTEINVGRVQGNELMLPKGNVSKHHARLLYRDGRFIVTDLKSTNGTYVNGRKITQATIVREGDKIYVGDFILRLEVPQGAGAPAVAAGAAVVGGPAAPPPPEEHPERISSSRSPSMRDVPPPSHPPQRRGPESPVSHYPLENDPDDQSWSGDQPMPDAAPPAPGPGQPPVRMPAPPRVPSPPARVVPQAPPSPTSSSRQPGPIENTSSSQGAVVQAAVQPQRPPVPVTRAMPPVRDVGFSSPESVQIPAQRIAAAMLVERLEQTPDVLALADGKDPARPLADRIDRAIREAAGSLRSSGEIGPQVDVEGVVRDARDEILGLGPLGPLLGDEDVLEIHVHRYSWMSTLRSTGPRRAEIPFATANSVDRILRRLCAAASVPVAEGEDMVERQVHGGSTRLVAAFPPVSGTGPVATLLKCPPATLTLEDLVRAGTMSRAMASFLGQAVAGHVNVLVTVAPGADGRSMIASLLASVRADEHVVVAHDSGCQLALPRNATSILTPSTREGAAAVHIAARLGPDCLFVTNCEGLVTSEVLDAVAGGCDGVVAVMRAPTLRHAFARAVPEIAALRPGLPVEAVREWLNASFDVAVEVVRLRDGRSRVSRIAEPAGVEGSVIALRDIFTFTVERTASGGAVEGSFHPSGVVPKVAENLQARGLGLDPGLFRR